ncbi:hypothetical protein A1O1_08423 [Capronia coronata CBS 617.96]|uniref:RNase MRP protein 1 RNA binding domain-containing protein n=1 Tax=Capronia coronata CBS 617.96 TaxID=1182541 RepID=W9XTG1_9EURO|nr:uncharacterized protein A1O1_08423 [Capronia coronata CBS 617.96]EXJ80281.1 hypothetical protein A1O1_08423 [Capronia coronata CBS 617.96]
MSSDQSHSRIHATGEHPSKRRKLNHPRTQPPLGTEPQAKGPIRTKSRSKPPAGWRRTIKPRPPRQIRPLDYNGKPLPKNRFADPIPSSSSAKKIPSNSTSSFATPPSATPDSSAKLSSTKSLLDQIWARNKNQHRAQPWWKSLGMLRKAITRIVAMDEAERSLQLQSNTNVNAIDAKEVRKRFEQETQIRRERDVWFDWIREVLIPRAYIGFTGLVGDTQFAALGVVLVGILADVMSVAGAPKRVEDDDRHQAGTTNQNKILSNDRGIARSLAATSLRVTGSQSGEVVERMYDSDDLGEVVERTKREPSRDEQLGTTVREEDVAMDEVELASRTGDFMSVEKGGKQDTRMKSARKPILNSGDESDNGSKPAATFKRRKEPTPQEKVLATERQPPPSSPPTNPLPQPRSQKKSIGGDSVKKGRNQMSRSLKIRETLNVDVDMDVKKENSTSGPRPLKEEKDAKKNKPTMTKKKAKKNAIDDMFAGFT